MELLSNSKKTEKGPNKINGKRIMQTKELLILGSIFFNTKYTYIFEWRWFKSGSVGFIFFNFFRRREKKTSKAGYIKIITA